MVSDIAPVMLAIPDTGVDGVVRQLTADGYVGWAVSGVEFGHAGHVLALLAADDGGVPRFDADGSIEVELHEPFLDAMRSRWPGAELVDEELGGQKITYPTCASAALPFAVAAVTPRADLSLGVVSKAADVELHRADLDGQILVGMGQGADVQDDFLEAAFVGAKGITVLLWRRGPVVGLALLRKGKLQVIHWWAPEWSPIGQDYLDELRDVIGTPEGDAKVIADLLGRPDDVVTLRALLRRRNVEISEIVETFELPSVMTEVLEGRTTVMDLPNGEIVQPETVREAVRSAMANTEFDPAWMRALDEGPRELRAWYVISSVVSLVVGAVLIYKANGIDWFMGSLGLFLAGPVVIDLPVRWWLKRRRSRRAPLA